MLTLYPENYAVSGHTLKENKRGDLGRIILEQGIVLKGTVLDAAATPLAGVTVNVRGYLKMPPKEDMDFMYLWAEIDSLTLALGGHGRKRRVRDGAAAARLLPGAAGRARSRPREGRDVPPIARAVRPAGPDPQGGRDAPAPGAPCTPARHRPCADARFQGQAGPRPYGPARGPRGYTGASTATCSGPLGAGPTRPARS